MKLKFLILKHVIAVVEQVLNLVVAFNHVMLVGVKEGLQKPREHHLELFHR